MNYIIGFLLIAHGLAHLVGFLVPWQLMVAAGSEYNTTILGGAVDLGDGGIRALGLVWLIVTLAFLAVGSGALTRQAWWKAMTYAVTLASLALCLLQLPEAVIGVYVNVGVLVLLVAGTRLHWLEPAK